MVQADVIVGEIPCQQEFHFSRPALIFGSDVKEKGYLKFIHSK